MTQPADNFGVPAGYRPATLMSDSVLALICETCGASVPRSAADLHSAWHERLYQRTGLV